MVIEKPSGKKGEAWRVGLADGRVLPFAIDNAAAQRKLVLHDVVFVRVTEGKGKTMRAELRIRPQVQGTVVVMENKTGRILAMSGGFSYPLSQLNRATQSVRQPGSAIKPLSYLAALRKGLQPNTLVSDGPITLPPIGGRGRGREQDYWTPKNYDGGGGGILTLRRALENSRNLATVHLLDGGIEDSPEASLERLCALAMEAQIYRECQRYYPFVLGAQPVRPVDLAAFYAAIANEGVRPSPYVIETIERDGLIVYRHDPKSAARIGSVDRAAFYQLKTMLQGVLSRGTARAIGGLAPFVAGKTGTSDEENDAWFVGFSNDVTVAVWVGYDNAVGKRRTLGSGATGGAVAVPIFQPVMQAAWASCRAQGRARSSLARGASPAVLQIDRSQLGRIRARRRTRRSPNASASTATGRWSTPSISWCRARTPTSRTSRADSHRRAQSQPVLRLGRIFRAASGVLRQSRAVLSGQQRARSAAGLRALLSGQLRPLSAGQWPAVLLPR